MYRGLQGNKGEKRENGRKRREGKVQCTRRKRERETGRVQCAGGGELGFCKGNRMVGERKRYTYYLSLECW